MKSSEYFFNRFSQLLGFDRLFQVSIGFGYDCVTEFSQGFLGAQKRFFGNSGHYNHGNVLQGLIGFQLAIQSNPAFARHQDIEDNQVRLLLFNEVFAFLAVGRLHRGIAVFFQYRHIEQSHIGIIIHNYYLFSHIKSSFINSQAIPRRAAVQ